MTKHDRRSQIFLGATESTNQIFKQGVNFSNGLYIRVQLEVLSELESQQTSKTWDLPENGTVRDSPTFKLGLFKPIKNKVNPGIESGNMAAQGKSQKQVFSIS